MRSEGLTGPAGPGLMGYVAVTAEAAGLRWKWLFCWSFNGPSARSVAAWIVVPGDSWRNDARKREHCRPPRRSELLVDTGVAAQRVMGEIQLVALAHEHAERAVALARGLRYGGHAAAQQLDRRCQLARVV